MNRGNEASLSERERERERVGRVARGGLKTEEKSRKLRWMMGNGWGTGTSAGEEKSGRQETKVRLEEKLALQACKRCAVA